MERFSETLGDHLAFPIWPMSPGHHLWLRGSDWEQRSRRGCAGTSALPHLGWLWTVYLKGIPEELLSTATFLPSKQLNLPAQVPPGSHRRGLGNTKGSFQAFQQAGNPISKNIYFWNKGVFYSTGFVLFTFAVFSYCRVIATRQRSTDYFMMQGLSPESQARWATCPPNRESGSRCY